MKKRILLGAAAGAALLAVLGGCDGSSPEQKNGSPIAQSTPTPIPLPDWRNVADPVARALLVLVTCDQREDNEAARVFYSSRELLWRTIGKLRGPLILDRFASLDPALSPSLVLRGLGVLYKNDSGVILALKEEPVAHLDCQRIDELRSLLIASLDDDSLEGSARLDTAKTLMIRYDVINYEAIISREKALNALGKGKPGTRFRKKIDRGYFHKSDYDPPETKEQEKQAFKRWLLDYPEIENSKYSLGKTLEILSSTRVVDRHNGGFVSSLAPFYEECLFLLRNGNRKIYLALIDCPHPVVSCAGYFCFFIKNYPDKEEIFKKSIGDQRLVRVGSGCVVHHSSVEERVRFLYEKSINFDIFASSMARLDPKTNTWEKIITQEEKTKSAIQAEIDRYRSRNNEWSWPLASMGFITAGLIAFLAIMFKRWVWRESTPLA